MFFFLFSFLIFSAIVGLLMIYQKLELLKKTVNRIITFCSKMCESLIYGLSILEKIKRKISNLFLNLLYKRTYVIIIKVIWSLFEAFEVDFYYYGARLWWNQTSTLVSHNLYIFTQIWNYLKIYLSISSHTQLISKYLINYHTRFIN